MRNRFAIIIAALCPFLLLFGRSFEASAQDTVQKDSIVVVKRSLVDSTLVGRNILSLLPSKSRGGTADVKVHQSQAISSALSKHIASNSSRNNSGYRVRIYFDSKQNSREVSESTMYRFLGMFPGIPAYRSYQAPFFKVTVGDFRTKSEAMELLQAIKGSFPTAFVVKEDINYPDANHSHNYMR